MPLRGIAYAERRAEAKTQAALNVPRIIATWQCAESGCQAAKGREEGALQEGLILGLHTPPLAPTKHEVGVRAVCNASRDGLSERR